MKAVIHARTFSCFHLCIGGCSSSFDIFRYTIFLHVQCIWNLAEQDYIALTCIGFTISRSVHWAVPWPKRTISLFKLPVFDLGHCHLWSWTRYMFINCITDRHEYILNLGNKEKAPQITEPVLQFCLGFLLQRCNYWRLKYFCKWIHVWL